MTTNEKIISLRKVMKESKIDAYIIPSNDPHMSEYPPSHWKSRKWISGFSGSLGTVIITQDFAGLWVDSRYFLQGENELKGTLLTLQKQRGVGTPDPYEWLLNNMKDNDTIGIDSSIIPFGIYNFYNPLFEKKGINFNLSHDLISKIWTDNRPPKPLTEFFIHIENFSGENTKNKIYRLREYLNSKNIDGIFINGLDEIAWLLNIRARDVEYNPVGLGFIYIDMNEAIIFTYEQKTKNITEYLSNKNIKVKDYDETISFIFSVKEKAIALDSSKICMDIYSSFKKNNSIIDLPSPIAMMKSIKNITEIEGIKYAMKKDGVALTKFFKWLDENISEISLDEYNLGKKLTEFRSKQENYFGDSFGSIVGYKDNGAIVHYSAPKENSKKISPEGILLIDSGGQYFEGTTDITRTICLGNPSEEQKKAYTLVLKGHINLHITKFPYGKSGSDLELLARVPLWKEYLNFGHGVGHGVGAFLNVHEGPYSFAVNDIARKIPLEKGMILSNEPGYYKTNEFGIRIENLVLVKKGNETEYGQFMEFEELTLFPINTELVEKKYLYTEEIKWLNDYNKKVFRELSPLLNNSEKEWLLNKCESI